MKILFLADPNSPHIIKWAKSLAQKSIDIHILGLTNYKKEIYAHYQHIGLSSLGLSPHTISNRNSTLSKLVYLSILKKVKKTIKDFEPDILHAHYATSYGLLAALSGFKPFVLSVWGSDVFDFPKRSFIHKAILKYNLRKADRVLSTSKVMAKEIALYTSKKIEVTPFGIDLNTFCPQQVETPFGANTIIIGTVKSLEEEYGITYLIKAFKIVSDHFPELPLRLLIVGGGSQEYSLKQLVKELKIDTKTLFVGNVPYKEVPKYHNMMDISVFLSNSESFGVSVIEASACEKPVVVSNIGGLPEVVEEDVSGFIVPAQNPIAAAQLIENLVGKPGLRKKIGQEGRLRVKKLYDWNDNLSQILAIYKAIIPKDS